MTKHALHKEQLRKKGWTAEEIRHAEKVLAGAEEKKHGTIKFLDGIVYWLLLLLTLVGIGIFASAVMPLLLVLDPLLLAVVLLIVGGALGMLFVVALQDLHWLGRGHHGLAVLALLAMVGAAFFLAFRFADAQAGVLAKIFPSHASPLFAAIFFALGLLAPYAFYLVKERPHRRLKSES